MALEPGTLYLVATPIGNLGDVTARALDTLREADWIAAEDTRHTRRLLAHFGIATPLVSVHEHNEAASGEKLARRLAKGERGALVVDAGSPAISDPGARVVRAVVLAGGRVRVVPGPSAVVSALSLSGFGGDAFTFAGFLPARASARRRRLEELVAREEAIVLYEAPHRVRATLDELADIVPGRSLAACRELTKVHEEVLRGTALEVSRALRVEQERGEWVLVLGPAPKARVAEEDAPRVHAGARASDATSRARFVEAQLASGASREDAERRADFVLGGKRGRTPRNA